MYTSNYEIVMVNFWGSKPRVRGVNKIISVVLKESNRPPKQIQKDDLNQLKKVK